MKNLFKLCLVLCIAVFMLPIQAFAYSYGDPTEEPVAETLKLITARLGSSPADWNGAYEAYKVRKSEISSHFGESITVTLDHNFEKKQKETLIENYKYVLYLNLDRRFTYALKDINDYGKAKILLGKAKGTFDVLRPYVEANIPNKVASIDTAFNKALDALGNPGLFGMGKKPVKPEQLKEQANYILTTLKPLFTYTKYEPEQGMETTGASQANETSKKQEASTSKEESAVPNKDSKAAANTKATAQPEPKKETSESQKTDNQSQPEVEKNNETTTDKNPTSDESEKTDASAKQENQALPENNKELEDKGNTDSLTQKQNAETGKADGKSEALETSTDVQAAEEHAPMEQTDKTNPVITMIVIASVVIAGIGGIWFAKKKKFI